MCLSTYWQSKLANEFEKISAFIVKYYFVNFFMGITQECVFLIISDVKVTLRQDFMDMLRVGIRQGEWNGFDWFIVSSYPQLVDLLSFLLSWQILVCFTLFVSFNMAHMSSTVQGCCQQMMPLKETFWSSLTNSLCKWSLILGTCHIWFL